MVDPTQETCPDCSAEIARLSDELLARAPSLVDPAEFVALVGERLRAVGIPAMRISVGGELLHPTLEAAGWRWRPGQPVEPMSMERRDQDSPDWLASPMLHLLQTGGSFLQLSVDDPDGDRFPIMGDLREVGATEYLLFLVRIEGALRITKESGLYLSIAHSASFRLDLAAVQALQKLVDILVLVFHAATAVMTARTLLGVYLGEDATDKVLAGNVVRGRADPIDAVIWYSDLADFTKITDEKPPKSVLALLNDYAALICDELGRHGGNVLKFMGDGILAVFQGEDTAARALAAVDGVRHAVAELNVARTQRGDPATGVYIALHHGELLYGNFGSTTRMDFTVLGQAVNQASRIAAMSRTLDQPVIVSEAFADAAGPERQRLVSLGRYALRGVARPQSLFTLDLAT